MVGSQKRELLLATKRRQTLFLICLGEGCLPSSSIFRHLSYQTERITTMLNLPSFQPDRQMYITDSKCDASAASNLWKTSANPRFWRRRSHRRPRRRKIANAAKLWIFRWFLVFLTVLYVGLVAFLHSRGIVVPNVYLMLGQIFLVVLRKMPPPPAGEDHGSNYTLQA